MIGMRRSISQPGWSASKRKAVRPRRSSSLVRATRMKCCASAPPVMNHLRPLMRQWSPSRSALVSIIEGSEPEPGAGSVMAKEERTRPSMIGSSQRSFCASVPTRSSRIMLPSSGAAQLKLAGPNSEWPISS